MPTLFLCDEQGRLGGRGGRGGGGVGGVGTDGSCSRGPRMVVCVCVVFAGQNADRTEQQFGEV